MCYFLIRPLINFAPLLALAIPCGSTHTRCLPRRNRLTTRATALVPSFCLKGFCLRGFRLRGFRLRGFRLTAGFCLTSPNRSFRLKGFRLTGGGGFRLNQLATPSLDIAPVAGIEQKITAGRTITHGAKVGCHTAPRRLCLAAIAFVGGSPAGLTPVLVLAANHASIALCR
jgi:hypothetical protein